MSKDNGCPCGSGKTYALCCEPLHRGKVKAANPEALMRARYSAYVTQEIDFILKTCIPDEKEQIDPEATRQWSLNSQWEGLKIVSTSGGGLQDTEGTVEFEASYVQKGLRETHHEVSHFVRQDGEWLYKNGRVIPHTLVRAGAKIGRNDPCSCGSGKKYKHCCGS